MKAQIKMLETVAVLVVFFILLVIGSSVYFGIQNSRVDKERILYEDAEAFRALVKLQSLPELDCSFASARTINCFDLYKLKSFSALKNDTDFMDFYYPIFGDAQIKVNLIYPVNGSFVLYDISSTNYKTMIKKYIPVVVYDSVFSKYYFAVSELIKYA